MVAEMSELKSTGEVAGDGKFKQLRVWPAIFLVVSMIVFRFIPTLVSDGPASIWMTAAFGPALCGLAILVWWLAYSRARWTERLAGVFGLIVLFVITMMLLDKSMLGPGAMILTFPIGLAGFAIAAFFVRNIFGFQRTVIALSVAAFAFASTLLLRTSGVWGDFALDLNWRWNLSAEQKFVNDLKTKDVERDVRFEVAEVGRWIANPEWPAFRGPLRDGTQHGPLLSSDWIAQPPELMWKIPVGPAWSSFAVAGKLLFTQEQRGGQEAITCYNADDGTEIWAQQIESRFDDPLGGPGPRATPSLSGNGLFCQGASGQLLKLDPQTGEVLWQVDLKELAKRDIPMWGFSASPLVIDSSVIAYAGGDAERGLFAFDVESGAMKWSIASGESSYSSPHSISVDGKTAIVMLTETGADFIAPESGKLLLAYGWKHDGYRSLQPQLLDGDRMLIPTGSGSGTRCIKLELDGDTWSASDLWTSRNLKPDFNDLVVFEDHAYGFDNSIFTCINLENGQREWKGGRYGKGQVLLLKESRLLLVASEFGEAILLKADPTELKEAGKIQAVEGKTWNHPVIISDKLYFRNAEQAACYRLPFADNPEPDQSDKRVLNGTAKR